MAHGNAGKWVQNLFDTKGCSHYKWVPDKEGNCPMNDCDYEGKLERCHVIAGNQNCRSGVRMIVHMCHSCNMQYGYTMRIHGNVRPYILDDCQCGYCGGDRCPNC
jgi:hypothetical protein